jgi:hypothetical protein
MPVTQNVTNTHRLCALRHTIGIIPEKSLIIRVAKNSLMLSSDAGEIFKTAFSRQAFLFF